MKLFLINTLLAFAWMAWHGMGLDTLLAGFLIGLALLRLSLPLYHEDGGYFRRLRGFVVFLGVFARELLLSTYNVSRAIVFEPVSRLRPGLFTLDSRGMNGFEILLLTHCITLTPGTTSVDVAKNRDWILVHALDCKNPRAQREAIEKSLKAAILGFTR
jgi:multisubunit Na+/H+ antiporter MnhE subunit